MQTIQPDSLFSPYISQYDIRLTISTHFTSLVNSGKLQIFSDLLIQELRSQIVTLPSITGISQFGDNVIISPSSAISSNDLTQLLNICSQHNYDGDKPIYDNRAYLSYMLSAGTNGGSIIKNNWITIPLNTIYGLNHKVWVILGNLGSLTIINGRYNITCQFSAPNGNSYQPYNIGHYQLRLYDHINNKTLLIGQNNCPTMTGLLTLDQTFSTSTHLTLQVMTQFSVENVGLGLANGFGENEIYATVIIDKIG